MRLYRSLLEQAGGDVSVRVSDSTWSVRLRVPVAHRWTASRERVDGQAAVREVALAVHRGHGMAQPLLEARWLLPGPASDAVTAAMGRVSREAAALIDWDSHASADARSRPDRRAEA